MGNKLSYSSSSPDTIQFSILPGEQFPFRVGVVPLGTGRVSNFRGRDAAKLDGVTMVIG